MAIRNEDLRAWVADTEPGTDIVYRKSGRPRNESLFETARKLSDAGLVFLYQRRNSAGGWDHHARRTTPQAHVTLDKVSRRVNLKGAFR